MSRVRLAPNTAVAHSAATASTMPSSAVPTGTGCRPRPRSSAYRIPISALGGAPIQATARTSAAGTGRRGGAPRSSRASRTAGQADSATTVATVASAPTTVTSGSKTTAPAELAASRASPTGVSGESSAASATAPAAPSCADDGRAGQAKRDELRHPQPDRGQRLMIILIGDELPGGGLPDDSQPGQRDQARQHPPAHSLRPDRALHRGGVDIQGVGAENPAGGAGFRRRAGRPRRAGAARSRTDTTSARGFTAAAYAFVGNRS